MDLLASEKKPISKKKQGEMPVPKMAEKRAREIAALKRLGVSQEEVESAPSMSLLLKEADGGLKAVMIAMRFNLQNETIKKFIETYDAIPSGDRERIPWEAVVIAADLDFDTFYGAAGFSIASYASNKSKIILSSSHPKIARARIKYGLMAGGEKDRTAIDTMVGALPSPKGPTFIGKAVFGGAAQTANEKDDDEDGKPSEGVFVNDGNLDALFPPSGDIQEKLIPIRQKLLE